MAGVEIIGTIISLVYLYLEIKENFLMWFVGFLASVFYIFIFYQSKFYADMGLQFYYLLISIYGIYYWTKGGKTSKPEEVKISRITLKILSLSMFVTVLLFFLLSFILNKYTDSPLPYWDSLTTALSITATWLLARKIIEHWYFWVVINIISASLYIYKGLYPTAFLYFVYFVFSFVGYFQWKNNILNNLKLN